MLLLGVVGISAWSAVRAARHAEARIAQQVRGVTHALAGSSISLTPRILEQMKGLSGADYLLEDAEGYQIATLPNTPLDLPPGLAGQPVDDGEAGPLGSPIDIHGQRYRGRRLPQRAGGNLYILYPEESLNEAIRDAVQPSLVFGLTGGLMAIVVMFVLGQRLVGRIRELDRRTRQIAGGDFSPMPLPRPQDELRDLSQSVNDMAQRLQQLHEAVRATERYRLLGQLSSGLAHQLRNSVTGARLAIQLHLQTEAAADPEALEVALRQLNLMEANLRRFMDLGKPEPRAGESCVLADVIEDVVALQSPQAKHLNISLNWQRPTFHSVVKGDAGLLRDVVQNLIGNAIEAAGVDGNVSISLAPSVDPLQGLQLTIRDTGPGPAAEVADRLFEPFVTGKPEGVGLGLAVVRNAVQLHGGTLRWYREAGSTFFEVVLPTGE